ncbi:MAG: D-alanyl-D-alanine carboxypeptidase [Clostridia bacterium]|nr:D-alanyl-D-alanine carboxypeptidase [Clostridia bacterium]
MKKSIKIIAAFFSIVLSVLSVAPVVCAAEPPEVEGVRTAILYNVENNRIIYALNENEAVYPASSVKLMTAVVAYRALKDRLGETVTVTKEMLDGVTGYRIGLEAGEQVTVESLFYAMLLRGSNDSANVLAHLASGSTSAFLEAMNGYARELGMENTLYLNTGGLHEEQMVTTAADTLKIAAEFAKEEKLLEMSSVTKYVFPATNKGSQFTLYNRNYVVSRFQETKYYYEFARGMNYGSTEESGSTCTSVASNGGLTYICVVIGGGEDVATNTDYAMRAVSDLLRYGIEGFAYTDVVNTEKPVCEMPVTLSAKVDHVMLYPGGGLSVYLPSDVDVDTDITTSLRLSCESLAAPVEKGAVVGYLNIYHGDTQIGTVELITGDEVERNGFLYTLEVIKAYSKSRFFRATAISAVILTVLYVLASAAIRRRRARKSRRYRF